MFYFPTLPTLSILIKSFNKPIIISERRCLFCFIRWKFVFIRRPNKPNNSCEPWSALTPLVTSSAKSLSRIKLLVRLLCKNFATIKFALSSSFRLVIILSSRLGLYRRQILFELQSQKYSSTLFQIAATFASKRHPTCHCPRRPQGYSWTGKKRYAENGLQDNATSSVFMEFLSIAAIYWVQSTSGGSDGDLRRPAQYVAHLLKMWAYW